MSIGKSEIKLLERFAELSGRPAIHTAVFHSNHKPEAYIETLKLLEEANTRRRVYGLGIIHRIGSLFNLLEYNLFDDMPEWNKALACPVQERIANLKNPEIRKRLQHDIDHHLVRVWSGRWDKMKIYKSENKALDGRRISEIAAAEAKSPLDVFCDVAVAEELRTMFYIEDQTSDDEAANAEIAKSPYIIPGVSDGGAHTQFLSMGKYPTVMLSKLVRDDKVMSLEEAHWRLSHMSASAIGLDGIGTLQTGMAADIVVYDLANLKVTPDQPEFEPITGGGKRLVERASGYRAIYVNGVMTFENGTCTGKLPGRVLRTSAAVKRSPALKSMHRSASPTVPA